MSEAQHHMVTVVVDDDGDFGWPVITCPHPADSYDCGLRIENFAHKEGGCTHYDEGNDGCNAGLGWKLEKGCWVSELAAENGLSYEDLGLEPTDFRVGEPMPVRVIWQWEDEWSLEIVPGLTSESKES